MINKYPYTDFNEYNMDWIIKTVKDLTVEWASTKTEWADYKTEIDNAIAYINNYFKNLDVQDEVSAKINEMAADGSLLSVIGPTVATETASWLDQHITQPEGVVIDTSLTVAGACADAKATGDKITDVSTDMDKKWSVFKSLVYLNLFNPADIVSGGYYDSLGRVRDDPASYYNPAYIPVDPDLLYSLKSTSNSIQMCTYDADKTFIARISITSTTLNYQFNQNVAFVRFGSYRQDFSGTVFATSTDYTYISASNPVLIDGDKIVGIDKFHVEKTASEITVYMGRLKYAVTHFVDPTIRVDIWRIGRCDVQDTDSYVPVWQLSDADGVIRIDGEDDFIGGYHGDEIQTDFNLYVDGVPVAESDALDTDFNEIMLYIESNVYHCNTSASANTVAFKRNKIITFNKNGCTVKNCWTAQENLNIINAYIGMLSVQKYINNDPNYSLIQGYSCNNDYKLKDLNTATAGNSEITDVVFNTAYGDIGLNLINKSQNLPYDGFVADYPSANIPRLKAYFENGNFTINTGEMIRGEVITYFN